MKEKIEREFKEMKECKRRHEKKDQKCKGSAVKSRTSPDTSKTCSKEGNTRKFEGVPTGGLRSALNELSLLSFIGRPGIARNEPAIIARLIAVLFRSHFCRYTRKLINFDGQ